MRPAALFLLCSACYGAEQASIEGVTVNRATGALLSGVHVRLLPAEYQIDRGRTVTVAYGAVSDGAGRFSMMGVPPGSYILAPERSGFMYILDRADARKRTLVLKPGDHITGSRLEMTPRAVIRGRVTNKDGDPVEGAIVRAVPVATDADPILLSGGVGDGMISLLMNSTNDRGEFRIIAMPGEYRVQAYARDELSLFRVSDSADRAMTYYPSATDEEQARVVEVAAGADVRGIDILLAPQQPPQSYRAMALGGNVTGIPGDSAGLTARVEAVGAGFRDQTSVGADGRFLFSGLRPGHYRVAASCCSSETSLASLPVDIQLENGDRTDLGLALQAGVELSGTLEMGSSLRGFDLRKHSVKLDFAGDSGVYLTPEGGEVDEGGAFRIRNVPPRRLRLWVVPLPDNVYVKSVFLNGAEAPGSLLDLSGGAPGSRLKVTVDLGGVLTGKVMSKDGGPRVFDAELLLIPENLATGGKQAVPESLWHGVDPDGSYTVEHIRPGKYRLLAVDDQDPDKGLDEEDPAALLKLAAGGVQIEFRPGDRITKNLTISEKGEADAPPKRQQ